LEDCVCAFKAPYSENGIVYTWDTEVCDWVCAPQTCIDDTYYWDAYKCKCACYRQTCPENHIWDSLHCKCKCLGIPIVYKEDPTTN
jgi:hypothetical protein